MVDNLKVAVFLWVGLAVPRMLPAEDSPDSEGDAKKFVASTFEGLKLRSIGPALMSGRISDVAIDPVKPNTWYVAVGSGNLWKTENAGTTWTPIFDNYGSYSIGCVSIDPNNRHTIWVGTGEAVGGRHVGYGDGIYRSRDGGQSFEPMGLKQTEHIAKILIDPRNSDVVYVAAQGPLWSAGGERGLYKSTNGGSSWQLILSKGPYTGVTDIAFDPRDPDVLYAATHQRHRTVWALINGGPETGIFKSTDAGATWQQLKAGLPDEDMGKISIAVSPQRPDVVYATIELAGRTGGFWKSEDAGASWTKQSDYISGGTGPHYYQEIFCDPHRFDVVYQVNVRMGRTEDGGKTWETVESPNKHVDNHAVAFHPTDPDFLLVGCDGGLYRSYDYARTFQYTSNLPLTQFYKLDVDYDEPFYHVIGGTQDNNTQWGPSRTANVSGIRNGEWRITIGGDGHDCAIDPQDPNIIYCESQQGYLRRYDRRSGQAVDIRPQPGPGEEEFRFNWDSPILISPHSHTRLYYGSKKLHRSDDRGDSWADVSGDLSRAEDRFTLKIMGRVWSIDALYDLYAMSQYGNITSISESPLQEGLIYIGTDDGLIQVTEDGGQNWRKIDRIYGIPEDAFVNDVKADLHDVDTVYAVLDNHKTGDFQPYLVKSTDRGRSWGSISGDLPERHIVWRVMQDHVKAELLFAGTEFGIFFTVDGGANWVKLSGDVPTIPFRDLEIQRRENDLVGASFGRSFYVLDDYTPLRTVSEERLSQDEFVLFPVRKTRLYVPSRPLGSEKGTQGDAFYTADNPPFGAVFTYYLRDALKTQKQQRREQEQKVQEAGGDNIPAGWDALKQEEREEDPLMQFTIADEAGHVINRVEGPTSAGFHRVAWDLRHAPFTKDAEAGPLVVPGTYTVRAARRVDDEWSPWGDEQAFEVVAIGTSTLPEQDRQQTLAFLDQVGDLQNAVIAANEELTDVLERIRAIKQVIRKSKVPAELYDEARRLELKLLDLEDLLQGDRTRTNRSQTAAPSILERIQTALRGSIDQTYGPTKTHRREYEIARQGFSTLREGLQQLRDTDLATLERKLDQAGAPWTPGRPIPAVRPESRHR